MPKTKIKDLLKQIGKWMLWDGDREVKSYLEFQELKQAIKSLRKENKRMKRELEAKYRHDDSLDAFAYMMSGFKPKPIIIGMDFAQQPVAEFKCAKTNKPEKDKIAQYWCVYKGCHSERIYMGYKNYHGHEIGWGNPDVQILAFTETEPGEIVDALNKDK